jgi:uncharacterized glyoxalase superfamily protein PhnB
MFNVILSVADVQKSIDFYRDILGFKVEGEPLPGPDGKPAFGGVMWGDSMVMFNFDPKTPTPEPKGSGVTLHLTMEDDIDAFYQRVQSHPVTITEAIHDTFWGERMFAIFDIDGYSLTFAKQIADVSFDEMAQHMQRGES